MKKAIIRLITVVLIISGIITLLNINVTTQVGINYKWQSVRIPLYLKALDFVDRHYNYKQLVRNITKGSRNEEDRVMAIFNWTYANIRKTPEDLPVIDDHIWNTIIRGYGASDQFSDVFTTLCNYAGNDALFSWVKAMDGAGKNTFSFVRINGYWHVFDPYNGAYFKDDKGKMISIEKLKAGINWKLGWLKEKPATDYSSFIPSLPDIKEIWLSRPNIQSPFKRLIFGIKKIIKK